MTEDNRQQHNQLQSSYFDKRFHIFCQAIPKEVQERCQQIVKAAHLNIHSKVLDVGTGCGALIKYFIECGVPDKNILGLDLTANMLKQAKSSYPHVQFQQADILDFEAGQVKFDAVFFNACFGNIFDQENAIAKSRQLLSAYGRIIVSHPLGAHFVASLHKNEPEIVPHLLPDKAQLLVIAQSHAMELEEFIDEPLFYLAVLKAN